MRPPSLIHWLKRWFWGAVIIFGLFAIGLAAVNVVEGVSFWRALHRVRQLDAASLRTLAETCTRYEKSGFQQWLGNDIPPEFRSLKPVRVSIYPGSSDVSLLGRNDYLYVFLRISTNPENQDIVCVSSGRDRQQSQTLWERNPEFTQRLNPLDRIVTVTQSDMYSARQWIVRSNELLVIDRHYRAGESHRIAARISLTPEQRNAIETAARSIGTGIRGHVFDSGGIDGIALMISFTADGGPGDGIMLKNTWRSEVGPLIGAITELAGKENGVEFPNMIQRMNEIFPGSTPPPDRVLTLSLAEYDRRMNRVPLPWWCLWPRLDLMRR